MSYVGKYKQHEFQISNCLLQFSVTKLVNLRLASTGNEVSKVGLVCSCKQYYKTALHWISIAEFLIAPEIIFNKLKKSRIVKLGRYSESLCITTLIVMF